MKPKTCPICYSKNPKAWKNGKNICRDCYEKSGFRGTDAYAYFNPGKKPRLNTSNRFKSLFRK